jgi:hypothetical protein
LNSSDIFLADENIPLFVIKQIRKEGCKIISVAEEYAGSRDEKILELSLKNLPPANKKAHPTNAGKPPRSRPRTGAAVVLASL